jgi:hypothetical protein
VQQWGHSGGNATIFVHDGSEASDAHAVSRQQVAEDRENVGLEP